MSESESAGQKGGDKPPGVKDIGRRRKIFDRLQLGANSPSPSVNTAFSDKVKESLFADHATPEHTTPETSVQVVQSVPATAAREWSAHGSGDGGALLRAQLAPESAASKGKAVTKPLGSPPKFNLPNASDDVFAAPAPAHVSPAGTNAVVPYTQQPAHYATTDLVDGKDPQHVFPIEACIFLANLPEAMTDASLQEAIVRIFSQWGTVWVKIRRDRSSMPFAFCQFSETEDATAALLNAKYVRIGGRTVRMERARANRIFVVSCRDGTPITKDMAKKLLGPCGSIIKVSEVNPHALQALSLCSAMLVEMGVGVNSAALVQAFQGDSKYQVKLWDIAHQLDSNYKAVDTPSFMRRYDMDRRSVHVGRLVSHIEEKHLEDVFKVVGEIEEIRIIRQAERTYAFVQFKSATAPDAAVRKFTGKPLGELSTGLITVTRKRQPETQANAKLAYHGSGNSFRGGQVSSASRCERAHIREPGALRTCNSQVLVDRSPQPQNGFSRDPQHQHPAAAPGSSFQPGPQMMGPPQMGPPMMGPPQMMGPGPMGPPSMGPGPMGPPSMMGPPPMGPQMMGPPPGFGPAPPPMMGPMPPAMMSAMGPPNMGPMMQPPPPHMALPPFGNPAALAHLAPPMPAMPPFAPYGWSMPPWAQSFGPASTVDTRANVGMWDAPAPAPPAELMADMSLYRGNAAGGAAQKGAPAQDRRNDGGEGRN